MINYTPFGHSDWQTIVADIKKFGSAGKKTAVVSTINGDANVPFYKELGNQGIKAKDIPVVAFSVGEEELAGIDTKPLLGHLAAWNYFQSIDTPLNKEYIAKWQAFSKNPKRTFNDPMEAHVIGFAMWVKAVEKAGSTDPDKVIEALARHRSAEPDGRYLQDACRTITSPSRCSSAKCVLTVSSTWCGRPPVSCRATPGRRNCRNPRIWSVTGSTRSAATSTPRPTSVVVDAETIATLAKMEAAAMPPPPNIKKFSCCRGIEMSWVRDRLLAFVLAFGLLLRPPARHTRKTYEAALAGFRHELLRRYRSGDRRCCRERQSAGLAGHQRAAGRPAAVQCGRQESLHPRSIRRDA